MQEPVSELADEIGIAPHLADDVPTDELQQIRADVAVGDALEQRLLERPPDDRRHLGEAAGAPRQRVDASNEEVLQPGGQHAFADRQGPRASPLHDTPLEQKADELLEEEGVALAAGDDGRDRLVVERTLRERTGDGVGVPVREGTEPELDRTMREVTERTDAEAGRLRGGIGSHRRHEQNGRDCR